jgi:threonine/homoserine/homoserine lactone efflux protein
VLNPKPALFFVSYLPQFVDRHGPVTFQVGVLAAIHIVIGFVWLTAYASLVSRLQAALARPWIKAALERATGAVLVALGLRVAVAHR